MQSTTSIINTTIQYENIIIIIIVASARPQRGQTLEAEARILEAEAEARTLEAEAPKFWPREASRPRPGLEA